MMKQRFQRPLSFLALLALTLLQTACVSTGDKRAAGASLTPVSSAVVRGVVKFNEDDKGMTIVADFSGLLPGVHTLHLQDAETCATMAAYRADAMPKYDKDALGGLLLALTADVYGTARTEAMISGITLAGDKNIAGRTIVLYAIGSDNRPVRMACGTVTPF